MMQSVINSITKMADLSMQGYSLGTKRTNMAKSLTNLTHTSARTQDLNHYADVGISLNRQMSHLQMSSPAIKANITNIKNNSLASMPKLPKLPS